MKKQFLLYLVLFQLWPFLGLWAQRHVLFNDITGVSSMAGTHLRIYATPGLNTLTQALIAENVRHNKMPGWRVQIFLATGHGAKENAEKIRTDFETANPERKAYLVYQAPYFRVHVGNFRTKRDAKHFQMTIRQAFPQSWPVKDQIELPDL